MKTLWLKTAIVSLILMGFGALQAAPQDSDENWWHERDGYYHGNDWRTHFFDRVRNDLSRVQATDFHGRDEFRLNQAQTDLTQLQAKMGSRQYDQGQLDNVIHSIERVVADNRLSPRNRDMLNEDLTRLREFREHHEQWWH